MFLMDQENLAKWIKGIVLGLALCGVLVYFYIIPFWGHDILYRCMNMRTVTGLGLYLYGLLVSHVILCCFGYGKLQRN